MSVLSDSEIKELLNKNDIIDNISSDALGSKGSQIQPSSLDLTVGFARIPGKAGWWRSHRYNKPTVKLKSGHTAIVITNEKLNVPDDISVLTFSPVKQSMQGLLILNQGHVDPGYKGYLRFIAINMGSDTIRLKQGQVISSLVFYRMKSPAEFPYLNINGNKEDNDQEIKDEIAETFSPDFLDFESRAKKEVENRASAMERRSDFWRQLVAGLIAAGFGYVLFMIADSVGTISSDISANEKRISDIDQRLKSLSETIESNQNQ